MFSFCFPKHIPSPCVFLEFPRVFIKVFPNYPAYTNPTPLKQLTGTMLIRTMFRVLFILLDEKDPTAHTTPPQCGPHFAPSLLLLLLLLRPTSSCKSGLPFRNSYKYGISLLLCYYCYSYTASHPRLVSFLLGFFPYFKNKIATKSQTVP